MAISIDYPDYSVHVLSPTTTIDMQTLLNDIRAQEASEIGITHPVIADASGKEALGGGIYTAITVSLRSPWQLEPYAGDYTLTINGGNLVSQRSDSDVIMYVVGGPQIEILRSASGTIAAVGGSILTTEEHDVLMGLDTKIGTPVATVSTDIASVKTDTKAIKNEVL